jgi:general secretion pathway protein B
MSYILDALRKSERQRPPGPVPDLFTVQGPQPPAKRAGPAVVATVALALGCAAVVGIWAWFGGSSPREVARPAPVSPAAAPQASGSDRATPLPVTEAASPQPGAAVAVKPARATDPTSPRAGSKESRPRAVAPRETIAASEPAAAVPMPAAAPAVPAAPAPAMAPAVPAPPAPAPVSAAPAALPSAAVPAVPSAATAVAPAAPPTEGAAAPVSAPAPAPSPAEAPVEAVPSPDAQRPAPVPPPDGRVVGLADLPAGVRSELPALTISGHVWSEEAALRLLTVQDRIVHEGGEAAPGVRLEEITQAGAVFVFRGWRFSITGF